MKSLDLLILRLGCSHGFFGQNCANKCNSTCTGCNSVNGSCYSGCIPGWTGHYCNDRDVIPGIHEFNLSFQYNALYQITDIFNLHVHVRIVHTKKSIINVKPTVWMIYLYTVLVHSWSEIDITPIHALEIRKCKLNKKKLN